jgi:hypothetical protein
VEDALSRMKKAISSRYLAVLIVFAFVTTTAAADECDRDDSNLLDQREFSDSYENGSIEFESRVESYSDSAKKYVWCVHNRVQDYILEVNWGNESNEKQYFDGFVPPNEMRPRIRSDSSAKSIAVRHAKYRRNTDNWHNIDNETIYYENLGSRRSTLTQKAQYNLSEYYDETGVLNVAAVIKNSEVLDNYLREIGPIWHVSYGVFDLPANESVANLIRNNKYEKYEERDFITVDVYFFSGIIIGEDTNSIEIENGISYLPHEKADQNFVLSSLDQMLYFAQPVVSGAALEQWDTTAARLLPKPGADHSFQNAVIKAARQDSASIEITDKSGFSYGSLSLVYFAAD